MLDHLGNQIRFFENHSGPISMIDMDNPGDFIASCSHDKKVRVEVQLLSNL